MDAWLTIGARFALYLDLMALFGLAAFGLYGLRGDERRSGIMLAFRPWLLGSALLGLGLSGVALALLAASMAGVTLAEVDRESVDMILSGTSLGTSWKVRTGALLVAALAASGRSQPVLRLGVASAAGAVALATLAWTGHGAAEEGRAGLVHLAADIAHLWAAGIWVGALLALGLLVARSAARVTAKHLDATHRALAGFSTVGTFVVGVLVLTGIINSWMLIGPDNLFRLSETLYGRLLIAKLLLFALMLALAASNRFRLTPALAAGIDRGDAGAGIRALRLSLATETASAVLILGLVAWLGTLAPPLSQM